MLARALRHSTSGDVDGGGGDDAASNGWPDVNFKDVEGLARLTPVFHGLTTVAIDRSDHDFLILDDVTASYSRPAILDIKMGRITFDPVAPAAKREKEERKYPPQAILGFRLLGYRMHYKDGRIVVKDKEWGKSFDEKNIAEGLSEFFSGRGPDASLMADTLSKLDEIRQWFAVQKSFHFYASSLLFAYENDPSKPASVQLVMIDFSHVFPAGNQLDTNYIHGLDFLRATVTGVLEKFKSKPDSRTVTSQPLSTFLP